MSLISLKNVSKFYYSKGVIASGFSKVSLDLNDGEFVAITGESGSGKSTLLNVISGLDTYEEGEMYINGKETSHYTEKDFEDYRRKYIGNIFQSFNLVNSYTVYQNVELVLLLNGTKKKEIKKHVLNLIKEVGLYKFRNQKVSKLSGGQKQRVAIARALAKDTPIIIADEPTGNLDSKSANEVLKLLSEIAKDKLVIVVTHNYEQIEKYVTRKITMHDGKIIEDKSIKEVNKKEYIKTSQYKNITKFNKLRLGIRNAFNIKVKFLLLLFIYLFIAFALSYEYSSYKEEKYALNKDGYNQYFMDLDDKRISINKKDKTPFTEEDYKKISKLDNIDTIEKNDAVIDVSESIYDNKDYWISGLTKPINNYKYKNVDVGRMPENSSEVLIVASKDNYYINNEAEKILDSTFYVVSDQTSDIDKKFELKIAGIKYVNYYEITDGFDTVLYFSDEIIDYYVFGKNQLYSDTKVKINDIYYKNEQYNNLLKIEANKNVPDGKAYFPEDYSYYCKNSRCKNKKISVKVDNMYFNDELELTINKTYNKRNLTRLTGLKNYYNNEGKIFISINDYNRLYNKGIYQITVRVKDFQKINETDKQLQKNGFNTFKISDNLILPDNIYVLNIVKTIVIIILVAILFVITYFVTKVILKSRNTYFSTIRMLGSTKKVCKNLLSIELIIISNIAYILFLASLLMYRFNIYKFKPIKIISTYISNKELIIIYVIISLMSYFISLKFARNIFKKSAISTMKEDI